MTDKAVWIAPRAFDPGQVINENQPGSNTQIDFVERRLSKIGTLDLDVSVVDGGFVEGDRTFRVVIENATTETVEIAKRLVQLHPEVRFSTREGVWLCAPASVTVDGGTMTFTLETIRKLNG